MAQMKEQEKSPEKELSEMKTRKLSGTELKTVLMRMLKELSEDLSSIKKNKSETKCTLIERKNNLKGIYSKVDKD